MPRRRILNNTVKTSYLAMAYVVSVLFPCIIIIVISCYPLQGHRASTKRRHLILFLASFLTSPQLFPSSNTSLWTNLLHVCLGLPLLHFPCGFQSKASFSVASFPFLNVCPIQFHFHLLICMDISISSALLQSSSFEIISGQWVFRIFKAVCSASNNSVYEC